mmetsp:Transcript_603/g.1275  ORF Transcript_603/g.1275 Transcript_603/m.1275 type:complete len:417 (-) Transcript_603:39-1289(-)
MGHAASIADCNDFFGGKEIADGGCRLAKEPGLRTCFIDFLKSGLWIDSLGVEDVLHSRSLSHIERVARETGNPLYAYKTAEGKGHELDGMFLGKDAAHSRERSSYESARSSFSSGSAPGRVRSNDKPARVRTWSTSEDYVSIEDHPLFSTQTLKHVLFSILFPLFLRSEELERYQESSLETSASSHTDAREDRREDTERRASMPLTATSQHMQGLMLACAAYHDESELLEDLSSARWTAHARRAIDSHSIALCVVDTRTAQREEGCLVVYANRAFAELTGHSRVGLSALAGKGTDPALQAELLGHIGDSTPFKACLTHYTSSGRPFLDLVATRPLVGQRHSGRFVLATFLPVTRTGRLEDLACADELLTIASYLVQPSAPLQSPRRMSFSASAAALTMSVKRASSPLPPRPSIIRP